MQRFVQFSNGSRGMQYAHPDNNHTYVRVMPGKPHSYTLWQRKPYVSQQNGKGRFDKHGNIVTKDVEAAHIPLEQYKYIRE